MEARTVEDVISHGPLGSMAGGFKDSELRGQTVNKEAFLLW